MVARWRDSLPVRAARLHLEGAKAQQLYLCHRDFNAVCSVSTNAFRAVSQSFLVRPLASAIACDQFCFIHRVFRLFISKMTGNDMRYYSRLHLLTIILPAKKQNQRGMIMISKETKNTPHIASCSFGKDSLATILLALEQWNRWMKRSTVR